MEPLAFLARLAALVPAPSRARIVPVPEAHRLDPKRGGRWSRDVLQSSASLLGARLRESSGLRSDFRDQLTHWTLMLIMMAVLFCLTRTIRELAGLKLAEALKH